MRVKLLSEADQKSQRNGKLGKFAPKKSLDYVRMKSQNLLDFEISSPQPCVINLARWHFLANKILQKDPVLLFFIINK